MNTLKASLIVLVIGICSTLIACIDNSDAGGGTQPAPAPTDPGVSEEDFNALKARVDELESLVATLAKSTNVVVTKGSATAGMSKTQALAYAIPANCASSGYTPGEHLQARGVECKADSGVIYSHPFKGGKPNDVIGVFYATSDCSDPGYLHVSVVSGTNMEAHGAVFRTRKGDVVWIPANPARTTATILAKYDEAFGCEPYTPSLPPDSLIEVQVNDPGVTGVDNNLPAIEVTTAG